MVYEKKCVVCGKTFTTTVSNKITCCKRCNGVRRNEMGRKRRGNVMDEVKTCIICGKPFRRTRWQQKCCSDECSRENLRRWHRAYNKLDYVKSARSEERFRKRLSETPEQREERLRKHRERYYGTEEQKRKRREQSRMYRLQNPEKVKLTVARYAAAHQDEIREWRKGYVKRKSNEINARSRAYRARGKNDLR